MLMDSVCDNMVLFIITTSKGPFLSKDRINDNWIGGCSF